jgi:hypothetical protein
MTKFEHTKDHTLDCDCSYCFDVDPNKSVSRELEKYVEELTSYSIKNLNETDQQFIYDVARKILLLRRYFPTMELPSKHQRLIEESQKN